MMQGTALVAALAVVGCAVVLTSSPDGQAARSPSPSDSRTTPLAEVGVDFGGQADATLSQSELDRTVQVRRGDTLMKLMRNQGVTAEDAHAAIVAMKAVYDPRELRPGQRITMTFRPDGASTGHGLFLGMRFDPSAETAIRVERGDDGFTAESVERDLTSRAVHIAGSIDSNLYTAGTSAGLPATTIVEMIRLFSWDVDFQRDIQPGDRFAVLIERLHRPDGRIARYGDILYAEMTLSGRSYRLYRYESDKHGADYYDEKGQSARKALLRTPIDGARLSSGYGKRHHPILGYTKMHRGLDFAAPSGTPIYAAGRGTIERIGRNGAYGNYIRIRHNDSHATAYAHMSRFAKGLKTGARVKQGEIIGYVGTTGRSTGPHLHYEVLAGGKQVNPLGVKFPSGRKLVGKELAAFRKAMDATASRFASTEPETRVGSR